MLDIPKKSDHIHIFTRLGGQIKFVPFKLNLKSKFYFNLKNTTTIKLGLDQFGRLQVSEKKKFYVFVYEVPL